MRSQWPREMAEKYIGKYLSNARTPFLSNSI
jgi:hypothetical protein